MDPISNLIISLKNASMVRRERIVVPFSKVKKAIADVLSQHGYVGAVSRTASGSLQIELAYSENGKPAIADVKRLSKPSRRLYAGMRDIRRVKNGHGLLVLSTPAGIMTGEEARKKHVGGETLFEIW
ncbi:MAG TPA: 30S ribosomal protein S8 [Candidatus Paceibacterota bacterium]